MQTQAFFFVVHLLDASGGRLASDEVWYEEGGTPDATAAGEQAAAFFCSGEHGFTEEEVEDATLRILGPFTPNYDSALEMRVVQNDEAETGWEASGE